MGSFDFVREYSPYTNREALLDDYTPDTLVGRDDELDEYHGALQPAIYGEQPDNIFLYGKAGVGKTAATRFLLNKLGDNAEAYEDLDVRTEIINCDGLNSSYGSPATSSTRCGIPRTTSARRATPARRCTT
jgi:cell division control protein 6